MAAGISLWPGAFSLYLALAGFSGAALAFGGQPGSNKDDSVILSAELVKNGNAVAIRTRAGTQILNPRGTNRAFAGYETPILSQDRHAAAWIEDANMPFSDASYAEPAGVWLFTRGRLVDALGCDEGRPYELYFQDAGRTVIVVCSFAHGQSNTHEVVFKTASGQCLLVRDTGNQKQQPCPK